MNKAKKAALNQTYHQFMDLVDNKGLSSSHKILDMEITGFGSAMDEKIKGIPEVKALVRNQIRQSKGMNITWKIRPFSRYISKDENTAIFADDIYLDVKAGKELIKMYLRFSTVLNNIDDLWKVVHWHTSKPEQVQSDEDTYGIDNLKQKNAELEKLVEEKTADLTEKNRELEIEASLERVRSRTMAMYKTSELQEVIHVVHKELLHLNLSIDGGSFVVINADVDPELRCWGSGGTADTSEEILIPHFNMPFCTNLIKGIKKGPGFFTEEFSQKEKKEFFTKLFKRKPWSQISSKQKKETLSSPGGYTRSVAVSKHTSICIINHQGKKFTDVENDILKRFAKVFDQTYTRFLDLQKAEAQAREAQIEIGLERVRSRAMAMQSSEELKPLIGTVFTELTRLDLALTRCIIWIFEPLTNAASWWMANIEEPSNPMNFFINYHQYPAYLKFVKEWKNQNIKFVYDLKGKDKKEWDKVLFNETELKNLPEAVKNGMRAPDRVLLSASFNNFGGINVASLEPLSDEHFDILLRFAKVFDLTYTRFLDLQKAESQAREAQIEAALERVRSRSMGMQKSEELREVIRIVYEQLIHLNIHVEHAGFLIDYKTREDLHIWLADEHLAPSEVIFPWFDCPPNNAIREAKEKGEDFFLYHLNFEEKNKFYRDLFKLIPGIPEETINYYLHCPGLAGSGVLLESIGLYIENFSGTVYSEEENAVLMRFGKVFQQTYTRFLDLQKAEAQARESQIEAGLERVRSRTLAMQKSDELAETAASLFRQLSHLGIEPNRLYINIIKDDTGNSEFWITDEDGSKITMAYADNLNNNPSFKKMLDGWKRRQKSLIIGLHGEELRQYFRYLRSIHVPFKGGSTKKRRWQYIAYFGQGFIGMASPDEQPAETLQLLERFAYVFNLTYTRFNDLKIAEAHALQAEQDLIEIKAARKRAEDALNELQSTQKQLIQSEKMASLGELTAGIAHEIQNPLNFVNNFSEVSNELIGEMNAELDKGDIDEAKAIAADVKQNLEKINHHGKRAADIVKGMLQHSRGSSGQKEFTDINALCDEYLRLAYHGLRAKDKSFNAKFETNFDPAIGKINVVPQDIGRVILNLINNAFYACTERSRSADQSYEPTVVVSTQKENDKVVIVVSDNGSGIPSTVKNKIFQPFFTTKPTGQGTGLGLSLSYDIVKSHGGEIKVSSRENEGTEFTIQFPF